MATASTRCKVCGLELFDAALPCPRCAGMRSDTWVALDSRRGEAPSEDRLRAAFSPDRRFEVIETIGRGGMGVVYKVRDRELDEVVALKVLDPLFGSSQAAVDRFKAEVRIARRINHPSVARLYDLFLWHGRLAISMEFIAGESLDAILDRGPLPFEVLLRYLKYIASGLDAAHRLGVVHRDLKPANILVDEEDRAHILDFGIATLAGVPNPDSPGSVFGTPYYMSPEQAFRPQEIDHRADLYSLGVVLYRMATGHLPFVSDDPQAVFHAHLGQTPVPPSHLHAKVPPVLERVILRLLEKAPQDRFDSARAIHEELESLAGGGPAPRAREGVAPRGRILLADDDAFVRRLIGDLLMGLGIEVLLARDGYECVDLALKERIDLILLDLMMPVLDGREALRILKANPRTMKIPVVMLTALSDPDEAVACKEMGASAFLNKPVEPDVLEILVERYAGRPQAGER